MTGNTVHSGAANDKVILFSLSFRGRFYLPLLMADFD
jgi:hypothetical protein